MNKSVSIISARFHHETAPRTECTLLMLIGASAILYRPASMPFPADSGDQRPIQLTRTNSPFLLADFYSISTDTYTPSRVSAGLYTTAVERNGLDTAEGGFRLSLPFTFNDGWGRSVGARRSGGELGKMFQNSFSMDSNLLVVTTTALSGWSVCWIVGASWLKMASGLLGRMG